MEASSGSTAAELSHVHSPRGGISPRGWSRPVQGTVHGLVGPTRSSTSMPSTSYRHTPTAQSCTRTRSSTRGVCRCAARLLPAGHAEGGGQPAAPAGQPLPPHLHVRHGPYKKFVAHSVVCEPGTVLAMHQNVWRCGQPNATNGTRDMLKVRLHSPLKQVVCETPRTSTTRRSRRSCPRTATGTATSTASRSCSASSSGRRLTGDDSFDVAYWLCRNDEDIERRAVAAGVT